jgi:MoxR-like ATPase
MNAARAWAFLEGRNEVIPEDVQAVLPSVAGHRLIPASGSTASTARVVDRLISDVPIP